MATDSNLKRENSELAELEKFAKQLVLFSEVKDISAGLQQALKTLSNLALTTDEERYRAVSVCVGFFVYKANLCKREEDVIKFCEYALTTLSLIRDKTKEHLEKIRQIYAIFSFMAGKTNDDSIIRKAVDLFCKHFLNSRPIAEAKELDHMLFEMIAMFNSLKKNDPDRRLAVTLLQQRSKISGSLTLLEDAIAEAKKIEHPEAADWRLLASLYAGFAEGCVHAYNKQDYYSAALQAMSNIAPSDTTERDAAMKKHYQEAEAKFAAEAKKIAAAESSRAVKDSESNVKP